MTDNKIILFEEYKNKKNNKTAPSGTSGKNKILLFGEKSGGKKSAECTMVWLYCSTCKTIEYTHVRAPEGRRHKCGTQVMEKEIQINVAREYSIALINLKRLEEMLTELSLLAENQEKIKAFDAEFSSAFKENANQTANDKKKPLKSPNENTDETANDKDNTLGSSIQFGKKQLFYMEHIIKQLINKEQLFVERLKLAAKNNDTPIPFTEEEAANDSYISNAPAGKYGLIVSEFHLDPEKYFNTP